MNWKLRGFTIPTLMMILIMLSSGVVAAQFPIPNSSREGGVTAGGSQPRTTNSEPIHLKYYVSNASDADRVHVKMEASLPDNLASIRVTRLPDNTEILTTDGFTRNSNGNYEWDKHTKHPTLTYTTTTAKSDKFGTVSGGTEAWKAVGINTYGVYVRYRYYDSNPGVIKSTHLKNPENGFDGSSYIYLGGSVTSQAQSSKEQIRVIRHSSVDVPWEKEGLESVVTASDMFTSGESDAVINIHVATSPPIRGGGYAPFYEERNTQDYIISSDVSPNRPNNIWVHEYIHTKQEMNPDTEMQWVIEGSAEYYAELLTLHQNRISFDQFYSSVRNDGSAGQLAYPSSWSSNHPYERGAKFIAALDGRIRDSTDNTRSFEDVFRRMNNEEGKLTVTEFKNIVETVSGESHDQWIDEKLYSDSGITIRDDPSLYVQQSDTADSDGDGLSDAREAELSTNPFVADSDGDGLSDAREIEEGLDPTSNDTDSDGLSDAFELNAPTLDPLAADTDSDGLSDREEWKVYDTNASNIDTDGDNLTDHTEVNGITDATRKDTDSDGLSDDVEFELGTDPTVSDTDDDGLSDGIEVRQASNATKADTDGDGLSDDEEIDANSSPVLADTDGDGIGDRVEVALGTSPTEYTGWESHILSAVGADGES